MAANKDLIYTVIFKLNVVEYTAETIAEAVQHQHEPSTESRLELESWDLVL